MSSLGFCFCISDLHSCIITVIVTIITIIITTVIIVHCAENVRKVDPRIYTEPLQQLDYIRVPLNCRRSFV